MIKFEFEGTEYEIKNLPTEITLKEFQVISNINANQELDTIDKYLQVFEYLGVPEEVINKLDSKKLIEIRNKFIKNDYEFEFVREIEIDGYTYIGFEGDKFELKMKDHKIINNYIKNNVSDYLSGLIAIIFKRSDLTKAEHYDDAHIKHKANLFNDLPYSISLPYLAIILENLITNIFNIDDNE